MADKASIAQAYVQILPTTDGIKGSLTSALSGPAEESGKSAGSKMGAGIMHGLGTVGKTVGTAFAAIGAAAVGASAALVKGTGSVASYGDNIDKMSQKMGMSAQAYQEWDAIMQHSGTSMETMQASMKTLATAAETGNDAFAALGITQEELASLNQEELFARTIEALQNVESDTQRTYLAGQLLGRGATELGALLNTSAEDTEAMRQRVHELGGVMSDEAVKAAAAYQDTLQDMQTAFSGLSRSLMSEFLPGINSVMGGLTEIFSGNSEQGLGMISSGISGIVATLTERIPEFANVAMGIVQAIGTALIENLPTLMPAAVDIVLGLVEFLIQNLPSIIDAALQMILAIADGLIQALPELIPAIVEVVLAIVDKLTDPDTIVQLNKAALQIIIAIAEGLIKALPELVAKAPEIVLNLVEAIVKAAPELAKAAEELIKTLGDGIINAGKSIVSAGKEVYGKFKEGFSSVVDGAKNLGQNLLSKLRSGVSEGYKGLTETFKSIVKWISETIKNLIKTAKSWGRDLLQNFISGIGEKISALVDRLKGIGRTVRDYLGFSEPEKGPLSDFHTFAPDMMELFAAGVERGESQIRKQLAKSFDFSDEFAAPNLVPNIGRAAPAASWAGSESSTSKSENVINITVPVEIDGETLSRKTYKYTLAESKRHGTSLIMA